MIQKSLSENWYLLTILPVPQQVQILPDQKVHSFDQKKINFSLIFATPVISVTRTNSGFGVDIIVYVQRTKGQE